MLGKLSEILGTIIRKKLGLFRAIASLGTKQSLVLVSIGVVTGLAVSYWSKSELSKSKKEIRQKEQEEFFELEKALKALHVAEEKNTLLHQAFDKINKTIEALSKTEEVPTPSQAIDRIKTIIEEHTQGEATSAEEPPNPEESPIQDTQGLEATSAEESPTPEESPIGTQVLEATSAEGGAKISRQRSPSPQAIRDLSIFSKRPFPRSRDLGEDLEPKI